MRFQLVALFALLAPAAGATHGVCPPGGDVCVMTTSTGSADCSAPGSAADRGASAHADAPGSPSFTMTNQCKRTSTADGAYLSGYLQLVVSAPGGESRFYWTSTDRPGGTGCHTVVSASSTGPRDFGCPLGPPPIFPAIP